MREHLHEIRSAVGDTQRRMIALDDRLARIEARLDVLNPPAQAASTSHAVNVLPELATQLLEIVVHADAACDLGDNLNPRDEAAADLPAESAPLQLGAVLTRIPQLDALYRSLADPGDRELLERVLVDGLAVREGYVFGRDLLELKSGEPWPPGELERYFDTYTEGPGIWKWRHYFPIYERYLSRFRGQAAHLVEIGVFSGGSLRMWREYLGKRSRITGVDIELACKAYEGEGISVVTGDQGDPAFWREFVRDTPPIDVVIDDGSHRPADQIITLKALLPRLRPGGIYLCEDMHGIDNRFCRFVDGFTRNLEWMSAPGHRPDGGIDVKTTPFQRSFASVHRYPFVAVFERSQGSVPRFEAPKHGTHWQPFYEDADA